MTVSDVASPLSRVAALIALTLMGCRGSRGSPDHPAWYEIARTPQMVAYLDTARVQRISTHGRRVWFRFVYSEPMQIGGDTTTAYRATEVREEIDCQTERVRGLEMKIETVDGSIVGAPTPDGDWQTFQQHPFNSGVFLVACRATGSPVIRLVPDTGHAKSL